MDKLRVAYVVWTFPKLSEPFVLTHVKSAVDRGCRVDVISVSGRPQESASLHTCWNDVLSHVRTFYRRLRFGNPLLTLTAYLFLFTRCMFENTELFFNIINNLIYDFRNTKESLLLVFSFYQCKDYDIVHVEFGHAALKILKLRELGILRGKLIVHFRGNDLTRFVKENGTDIYDELKVVADRFYFVCEKFANIAVKLGFPRDRIAVHRSGIDLSRFVYNPGRKRGKYFQLITVGRLIEKKGVRFTILAVSQLLKNGIDVELTIIGDGPLMKQLKKLAEFENCKARIHFFGSKTSDEIRRYLTDANCFICSSITANDGSMEGIPNTIKESMAVGTPVIATNHSGIPELVSHLETGFLVSEGNSKEIFEGVLFMMNHEETVARIVDRSRRLIQDSYDARFLNDVLFRDYRKLRFEK